MNTTGRDESLHSAVASKNLKRISQAISSGAELDCLDRFNMTPLMKICSDGGARALDIISLLLEAGVDVNCVRSDEMTALKFAAGACSGECVETLILGGASPDGPQDTRQTALMHAARNNNVEAIEVLVEQGADLEYPCALPWAQGKNALWLAEKDKCRKAAQLLRELSTGEVTPQSDVSCKTFDEKLSDLDIWLKTHRRGFYQALNEPLTDERLEAFAKESNLEFPEEFKSMLKWKDGQDEDKSDYEPFHPTTGEVYMDLSSISSTISMQNALLKSGDITDNEWSRSWLPFMDSGGGDHTCIELSPEDYGKIICHNHETGDGSTMFDNLSEWLTDLLEELNTLDFDAWDFEQDTKQ